ncbi:MAG: hypothetical protein Q7V88_18645 [Actinomycetota bacterium]|nr:hypothetical protein [Actinomycetota bacterium]
MASRHATQRRTNDEAARGGARYWLGACRAVAVLALLAACGNDTDRGGSSVPANPTTAPTPAATEPADSTAEPTTTTPGDEAALAEIRAAFETFFGGAATPLDAKVAVLQEGEQYRSMLADASADAQFQSLTIDIRDIRLLADAECAALDLDAPCAVVTHDLLVSGAPALVAQESAAVQVDGRWLVAASAWCAVVALGGETCP